MKTRIIFPLYIIMIIPEAMMLFLLARTEKRSGWDDLLEVLWQTNTYTPVL